MLSCVCFVCSTFLHVWRTISVYVCGWMWVCWQSALITCCVIICLCLWCDASENEDHRYWLWLKWKLTLKAAVKNYTDIIHYILSSWLVVNGLKRKPPLYTCSTGYVLQLQADFQCPATDPDTSALGIEWSIHLLFSLSKKLEIILLFRKQSQASGLQ